MTTSLCWDSLPPPISADRLQHRPAERRAGALRLQRPRQRRLPEGRGRLGRRLSRVLHDRRPDIPGWVDPQEPPGLRRTGRRRHLHHYPEHLPRSVDCRRSSTSTRPTCAPTPTRAPTPTSPTDPRSSSRRCRPGRCRPVARKSRSTRRCRSNLALRRPTRRPARRLTSTSRSIPSAPIANSNLRTAKVTLPPGMGLNPSAANGLQACTDAQFGKGTTNPVACPAASQIGTVSIQTPPLPPDSLAGNVYLGQQLSNDPASGDEFRIFVDAESARYGISARLIGQVSADPQTGPAHHDLRRQPAGPVQLLPAAPRRRADGAADQPAHLRPPHRRRRSSPRGPGTRRPLRSGSFDLTFAPGGGPCAKTLAERPFAPGFGARTTEPDRRAPSAISTWTSPGPTAPRS